MDKPDRIRLRHMLDAANEAVSFVEGRSREDLNSDTMLLRAVVKSIEIVGEAASKLSDSCKSEIHELPWEDIIGMRNRLIHAYFRVNRDVVWKTVQEDLPALIEILQEVSASDDL